MRNRIKKFCLLSALLLVASIILISKAHRLREEDTFYIDTTGKIFAEGYYSAYPFSYGIAQVEVQEGNTYESSRTSFIDKNGKTIFTVDKKDFLIGDPNNTKTDNTERLIPLLIYQAENTYQSAYLNSKGDLALLIDGTISNFHENLAAIYDHETQTYGFIDTKGQWKIAPQFTFAGDFSEGFAIVTKGEKSGYITQDGNWLPIPFIVYQNSRPFSEGLAIVRSDHDYFINTKGETAINEEQLAQYAYIEDFHDNRALVNKYSADEEEGLFGYLDPSGTEIIPAQFTQAESFSEGLALVEKDGKKGFIDTQGRWIIDVSQYHFIYPFSEGLAGVCKLGESYSDRWHDRCGFINQKGELVIPMNLETISSSFSEGFAVVTKIKPWWARFIYDIEPDVSIH